MVGQPYTGLPLPSSSKVTATSALAESRTLVALDVGHEAERHVMMVALVAAGAAVCLGELDAILLHTVHRPDMRAVGADDVHVFADAACVGHDLLLRCR